jgi:DegV family protein with EDD domain
VPLRLNFGDQDYLDKVGLTPHEFYRKLREEVVLPRTSQPPPGRFPPPVRVPASHHPGLVYLGVARAVSGTIQSAETAAQRGGHPERTHVFDTANAAGGQALLAIGAAELARQGLDAAAILAKLPATARAHLHLGDHARHLARGARRAHPALGQAAGAGAVPDADREDESRTAAEPGRRHVRQVQHPGALRRLRARRLDHGQRWRVIVGHCDAHADGAAALQAMRALLDCEQSWLVETGPGDRRACGPGALVISVQAMRSRAGNIAPVLVAFVLLLLCYLLGSLSGSLLLGRLRGVDIRAAGSGSTGGTNACARRAGVRAGHRRDRHRQGRARRLAALRFLPAGLAPAWDYACAFRRALLATCGRSSTASAAARARPRWSAAWRCSGRRRWFQACWCGCWR